MKNEQRRLFRPGPCIPCLLSLLFWCSCATTPPQTSNTFPPALPADTPFNQGAGRGNPLYITLHLESGERLLFCVDTGCDLTTLDKSLEPKLGKRLSSTLNWYGYYGVSRGSVFLAPALYLGTTRLVTADRICTDDLRTKSQPGRPIMGILGMDCLRHYCLQLDFDAHTIHFPDPERLEPEGLGKAFPLTLDPPMFHASYFDTPDARIFLDTGDALDGALRAGLFNLELKKQKPRLTNQWKLPADRRSALFPEGEFAGQTYTNLLLHEGPPVLSLLEPRIIGLRFLARHLVTLNFPKQMMYLQRRSVGPLPDGLAALKESLGYVNDQPPKDLESRFKALAKQNHGMVHFLDAKIFLTDLKKNGRLPGWLKDETGSANTVFDPDLAFDWQQPVTLRDYPVTQTLTLFKKGETSSYNYTVVQTSPDAFWHLQKAWKSAPNGKILKDYPIP